MVLIHPSYRHGFPDRVGPFYNEEENDRTSRCFPAANLIKHDDHAEIHLFVPGREKDDFKINLDNEVLNIYAEPKEIESGDYIQQEYEVGEIDRNFQISDIIDTEKIEAKYEAGILRVSLPFKEEQRPKKRDIKIS